VGQTELSQISAAGKSGNAPSVPEIPSQVYLYGGGSVTSYLTFTSSTATPGGSFPLGVTATGGLQANSAAFTLSTQVTTFQVTSVTGGGIVQNTGQGVEITQSVPANNAPEYTTCSSADPNVTCEVISSSSGTVTLYVTAGTGAVHGTRVVSLNGGAGSSHLTIADCECENTISSIVPYTIQAGQSEAVTIYGNMTDEDCEEDDNCSSPTLIIDGPGNLTGYVTSWTTSSLSAELYAGLYSAGDYGIIVNMCGGYYNPEEFIEPPEFGCWNGPVGETVTPAAGQQPAPVITAISSMGGPAMGPVGGQNISVVIQGQNLTPSPTVTAPGITVAIVGTPSSGAINTTFTIPATQPGGNVPVTVTVGGQPSNQLNFYVQVPTTLIRQTYPGNPPLGAPNGYGPLETPSQGGSVVNAAGGLVAPNACGVYRNLGYSLMDQASPANVIQGLAGVVFTETLSNASGTTPPPSPFSPGPTNLVNCPGGNGSSQCAADLLDVVGIVHLDGTCLGANENFSITQSFSVEIGSRVFPLGIANSVSAGSFLVNGNSTLASTVTISNP
jgi:hypothetical protein